ncbi:hypothetical protein HDU90_008544 [Geranomyces variabilis]|nr:hypothetical protein HDU90_008544 [Geranomyces variabilis]
MVRHMQDCGGVAACDGRSSSRRSEAAQPCGDNDAGQEGESAFASPQASNIDRHLVAAVKVLNLDTDVEKRNLTLHRFHRTIRRSKGPKQHPRGLRKKKTRSTLTQAIIHAPVVAIFDNPDKDSPSKCASMLLLANTDMLPATIKLQDTLDVDTTDEN